MNGLTENHKLEATQLQFNSLQADINSDLG